MKNKKTLLIIGLLITLILIILVATNKKSVTILAPFNFKNENKTKTTIPEQNNNTTQNITKEELKKQTEKQEIGDKSFVESAGKLQTKYPWYREFPIVTEDYIVVYDYEKESFRIVFKTGYSKELENIIIQKIQGKTGIGNINYYIK